MDHHPGRFLLAAGLLLPAACVERRMFVDAAPKAEVFVDGERAGMTPLELPFVHYGARKIVLRAEGMEPQERLVELEAPWYEWFPIDFFAECLYPGTLRDDHRFSYRLGPRPPEPDMATLRARAEKFRAEAQKSEERPK